MKTHYGPDITLPIDRYPVCHRDNNPGRPIPLTYNWTEVTCRWCLRLQNQYPVPPSNKDIQQFKKELARFQVKQNTTRLELLDMLKDRNR